MTKTKLTLIALSILALPVLAFAQPNVEIGSLQQMITYIQNAMWIIFMGIAVIMFVVAGILFLTAGGQPEKVASARSAFIWGIAGVVVGILAYSIVAIVSSVMQGGG